MSDAAAPDSTSSDDPLDDIVAAVADGVPVNWAEALARSATPANRALLPHLQLLADVAAAYTGSTRTDPDSTATTSVDSEPRLASSLTNERFVIEHFLGRGGFGVVHQAFDKERNARVALKTFTRSGVKGVHDFKNEFRVLAGLTHPNLVALYELFGDERSWLIAMELVPGSDFISHVRRGRERVTRPAPDSAVLPACDCDLTRLGGAMAQLYEALAYLHAAGIVHCDIKPSNVLVTPDGRVKVVDFGVAAELSQLVTERTLKFRGTPAYVSPEQAAGLPPTAASDWYGVGVMLFEALTGRRPFDSTVSQVLTVKQLQRAPSPATVVSGVPEELTDFCCRLLELDPTLRPSDADVLATLGRIWPAAGLTAHPVRPRIDQVPLIGRQAQLAVLSVAFESCSQRPQMVLLHGESGMGKSFLVRGFLARLRNEGMRPVILEGRCSERESVPFKALDSLIDHLADYLQTLPAAMVPELDGAQWGALARLFPALRRVEAVESRRISALIKDVQELRRRGAAALRDLLKRMAVHRPIVLVIDDLQWTDTDSAALLEDVLFGGQRLPLLFVGCYRTAEAGTNTALHAFLDAAQAADRTGVCALHSELLSELSLFEARELTQTLAQQLGLSTSTDAIVAESGGSPLFIHQLVQYAAADPDSGSPSPAEDGEPGPGTMTLDAVIRARSSGLGTNARRLLEVLAVYGGPLDVRLAGDVANLGEEAFGNSVALRTGRLARSRVAGTAEKLEVYHDRIREAIVDDIPPLALKEIHGRLAHALERSAHADPESLMHHFAGAGEDEPAAAYAVLAADRARDALAFNRAARLYRFALDRGRVDDGGRSIRVEFADALAASGRGRDAATAYLDAASHAVAAEVFDLERRASEQLLQSGHLDEGMTIVGDVLGRVGLRLQPTPKRALFALLALRARIAMRGFRFTERDERSIAPDALMRVDATWSVTTGLAIVDHIRSAEFGARNLLLALDAGEPLRIVRALAMELAYTSIAGARSQPYNDKLIAIGQPLAERVPNPEARALLTLAKGSADYMQGKWSSARELCRQATHLLTERCTRVAWHIDTAQFYTLLSSFYLGDLGDIMRRLPGLLKDARDRDALYAETTLRTRIAFLASLAADDVSGAENAVREGMARWSHKGFHNQHYYEMVACAETQLYAGRGRDAWTGLAGKWPELRRTLLLRVQPVLIESEHLRGRAAIAAALVSGAEERANFIKHAERSARAIEKTRAPWAIGLAQLLRSGIATLHAVPAKAIGHMNAAEAAFEREGMELFAAVVRRRRGELLGTSEGKTAMDAATAWMRDQSIANPDRFADMLAPGNFAGRSTRRSRGPGADA